MTKLYKTTGIEYEIEYPPPPEPPPPPPDPEVSSPPSDTKVETEDSPNSGGTGTESDGQIRLVSCVTTDGYKGIRMFVGSNPVGECTKVDYQGLGS